MRPLIEIQCFRRHLGWPVFAYLNCDGLEWIDRVVFGAASSAARALERSVPVRQTSLVKFVPVSGPSETSPVAGRPQLGQKLLAPESGALTSPCSLLMVLSTPIMRITAWPKFVSARRAASLNVPFHWPITGSGGARPVSKETQETEKTRLGSDWSDLMRRAVMASVPIVGRLELPFISRVLIGAII